MIVFSLLEILIYMCIGSLVDGSRPAVQSLQEGTEQIFCRPLSPAATPNPSKAQAATNLLLHPGVAGQMWRAILCCHLAVLENWRWFSRERPRWSRMALHATGKLLLEAGAKLRAAIWSSRNKSSNSHSDHSSVGYWHSSIMSCNKSRNVWGSSSAPIWCSISHRPGEGSREEDPDWPTSVSRTLHLVLSLVLQFFHLFSAATLQNLCSCSQQLSGHHFSSSAHPPEGINSGCLASLPGTAFWTHYTTPTLQWSWRPLSAT